MRVLSFFTGTPVRSGMPRGGRFQCMALEGVRVTLNASGLRLAWEGGEPGDTGIPRTVPLFYGLGFAQEIERQIDEKIEKHARAAEGASGRDD